MTTDTTMTDTSYFDSEYIILENIHNSSGRQLPLRQRDLAQIAGASLGMTNSILKRLAQKGWITIKKLNSRNIQYAVTLEGINEIMHRSYRYFKRTIRNAVYYKETLENLAHQAKLRKFTTVQLVGTSDLDFIVEHACRRWGLNFARVPESEKSPAPLSGTLKVFSEGILDPTDSGRSFPGEFPENRTDQGAAPQGFYLSRLVMKQAAETGQGVPLS